MVPDPDDSPEALLRKIAELQAQLAARLPPVVDTQGGAIFAGPVNSSGLLIGRDFIQVIQNLFPQQCDAERVKMALEAWLNALVAELAQPDLGKLHPGIDKTHRQPLQLADVYVPLNTTFNLPEGADLELAAQARDPGELLLLARGERGDQRPFNPATALQALDAHPALTLLGLPGSGKSTFGAHVLLAHAQAWQQRAPLEQTLGQPWRHGVLLPLRVVLRRFAQRHAGSTAALNAGHLWEYIAEALAACGWGSAEDALRDAQTLARRHGALILFDGLDECGDASGRARVQAAVQAFVTQRSAGPKSRCLLTARPYAFPQGADAARGIYLLAPLNDDQIGAFVGRWYEALVARGWEVAGKASALASDLGAACQGAALRPLVQNPLLLTMTALLHSSRKRLPDDRVDLYDGIVNLLLQRWSGGESGDDDLLQRLNVPGLTLGQVRSVIERVAFEAHEASVGAQGSAEISEHTLIDALRPLLAGSRDKAAQVIEFIEQRAGLLIGLGGESQTSARCFSFPHRTFQEFLAACHLKARNALAALCDRLYTQSFDHWRVVLPLAARLAEAERGAMAANEILRGRDILQCPKPKPTPEDWQRAHAAGLMLQEIGPGELVAGAHTTRQTLDRVRHWLQAGLPLHPREGGAPAPRRAEMGRVLAALGDPRFDPERLQLPAEEKLGFVHICADPQFRIGTRKADAGRIQAATGLAPNDGEFNEALTPSPEFWIARYAVTVAQFRAYLESTHQDWPDPDSQRDPANAPVRWVNQQDAQGYAKWLQHRLQTDDALAASPVARLVRDAGWQLGLPTELEWEKAARGGLAGAVFSWGDEADAERANVHDSGVNDTAPVGCFGANGFGLHDMLGNVWQWTDSPWTEQVSCWAQAGRPNAVSARASRVTTSRSESESVLVRGGAWNDPLHDARCAFRNRDHPDFRNNYFGFRVVLRSAPVSAP